MSRYRKTSFGGSSKKTTVCRFMSTVVHLGMKLTFCLVVAPAGPYCNRTWDGWLCWGDSPPGTAVQHCPNYFKDFDPTGGSSHF